MELLEGGSLRQALTRRGALPVAEVAEILQQAARPQNERLSPTQARPKCPALDYQLSEASSRMVYSILKLAEALCGEYS
jgi:hypothetical protein